MNNDIDMKSLCGISKLADKFLEVFPFEAIKKEIHDEIKMRIQAATESIEVDELRRQTTPMIWDFCFEKVLFHEAVREQYLKAFETITTAFCDYKYSQDEAITILDEVYKLSSRCKGIIAGLPQTLPSNADILMVYMMQYIILKMSELPGKVVNSLIERYVVITESSDDFYRAVLRVISEK